MSIKIWYQTEEQEFLHAEMQHYFEAVLQMQAEKASEQDAEDRKSTRLNSSHVSESRMPSSA